MRLLEGHYHPTPPHPCDRETRGLTTPLLLHRTYFPFSLRAESAGGRGCQMVRWARKAGWELSRRDSRHRPSHSVPSHHDLCDPAPLRRLIMRKSLIQHLQRGGAGERVVVHSVGLLALLLTGWVTWRAESRFLQL